MFKSKFILLYVCICKLVIQKVTYLSENGDVLDSEAIPNQRIFYIVYSKNKEEYKIKCTNNLYTSTSKFLFKQSICYYSLSLENEIDSHGSLNICDSVKGRIETKKKTIQITQTSKDINFLDITEFYEDNKMDDKNDSKSKDARNKEEEKEIEEKNTNHLKLFIINDSDRVSELGNDINDDVFEIIKNANSILERSRLNIKISLMGVLNILHESIFDSDFKTELLLKTFVNQYFLKGKDSLLDFEKDISDKEKKLEYFSKVMEDFKIKNDSSMISKSNLIILLTSKDVDSIEGLSYIGGIFDNDGGYSIINLSKTDSYFYKGKVLLHEILHSLGANHDKVHDSAMRVTFDPLKKEEDVIISDQTIRSIEKYVSENEGLFIYENVCGNGFVDGSKECDSGLPYGSECCNSQCKLIKKYTCDDRNGKCCKNCHLKESKSECTFLNDDFYSSSCQTKGQCNGITARCNIKNKKDYDSCGDDGYCLKGMCQTKSLFCRRLDREYEPLCPKDRNKLVCLDKQNICSTVFDSSYVPIEIDKFLSTS